jgi:alginate O-acetyltransferase complex protein AlgI
MLFNSAIFLVFFLPLTLLGYQVFSRLGGRAMIGWLALASLAFYSWWDWHFVFVLLGSILVNFSISKFIARGLDTSSAKAWMVAGILINLAILGYYKYLFHFLDGLNSVGLIHHHWDQILLPLGISFFTFTQIAYLIDLSQGEAEPQNLLEYGLFVTFFPHLISGPILHHKEMMPQFKVRHSGLRMDDMLVGISWFVLGFAKKCIIADTLANRADHAFQLGDTLGVQGAWCGIITYSLQLYFDFSGYSDMAIGLARMFSIEFPMNFNSPYKAARINDFWARWHMTLTRYLTLYIYNPIALAVSRRRRRAGKKVSQQAARTLPGFLGMIAWPTLATMTVAGVWHGAGLKFVIFGALHGIYLTINHAWQLFRGQAAERQPSGKLVTAGSVLLTYACVLIALVFFRASSTESALQYLSGMMGLHGTSWHDDAIKPSRALLAAIGLAIVWFLPNTQEILGQKDTAIPRGRWSWLAWQPTLQWSLAMGFLFFLGLLFVDNTATFLYFQF